MPRNRGRRGPGRLPRVNEAVKEVLAEQLLALKDPRLGFITVTDVRTSQDLRRSEIYYTVLPDDAESLRHTQQGLESATPLLRRELARRLPVRHVPELAFLHDPLPAQARRIEGLIAKQAQDDADR